MSTYTDTYAAELTNLEALGASNIRIEELGGGDFAIFATLDGHDLITGNKQPGLYTSAELTELEQDGAEIEWSISLYDADDELIVDEDGDTMVAAITRAYAALEAGADVDQ